MKFEKQLRPATETWWVVSYGGKTKLIPRWRTAAILKIDISPYLSEQEAQLSQRGRAKLRVCLQLASTYLQRSFLLLVTAASDLLVHKILLNSVLVSPIVYGGVRPKLSGQTPLDHNPLIFCRSWVCWGQNPASWVG